jgi:hypothetical protein
VEELEELEEEEVLLLIGKKLVWEHDKRGEREEKDVEFIKEDCCSPRKRIYAPKLPIIP